MISINFDKAENEFEMTLIKDKYVLFHTNIKAHEIFNIHVSGTLIAKNLKILRLNDKHNMNTLKI